MRRTAISIVLCMGVAVALGGAPDFDGDGVPDDLDCRPDDASLWAPPAEPIDDLSVTRVGSVAVLDWSTPADIGGDPGTERYDTYGTRVPDAFGHATGFCVDLDGGALTASDDRALLSGEVAHYLVRVENDCGPGPIGTDPPPAEPRSLNYLVVDNTNDTGPGSLREAIGLAQSGDAICIDATGTITLSSGGLSVGERIAIVGPGSALLTLEADSSDYSVLGLGEMAACSGVTIDGNELTNYGVWMAGGTTLDSMTIRRSSSGVRHGDATLIPAAIRNSWIHDNWRGIESGGPLTITSSTISNNQTGLLDYLGFSLVNLVSSTVHSNNWGVYAAYTYGGMVTIESSTISGNVQGLRLGVSGYAILQSSTISGNDYGLYNIDGSGRIENTIMSNTADCYYYYEDDVYTSLGHNLFSDSSCDRAGAPGDQIDVDPLLGPLADNGGPTETHLPLIGSPVIDAGSCPDSTRDQRGLPRPFDDPAISNVDDGCDIGATEKQ